LVAVFHSASDRGRLWYFRHFLPIREAENSDSEALENCDENNREGCPRMAPIVLVSGFGVVPSSAVFVSQIAYFWESNTFWRQSSVRFGAGGIGLNCGRQCGPISI